VWPCRVAAACSAPVSRYATRHICRDFKARHEVPRPGHSNPDLAAAALNAALKEAHLSVGDLAYLIGHTTSPARSLPPNIAIVADRIGFTGPYMELRQACTGFANALVIAQGLAAVAEGKAIGIVGSETGSVYLDPQRASEDISQLVNLVMMGDGGGAIVLGPDDFWPWRANFQQLLRPSWYGPRFRLLTRCRRLRRALP